jgi:predicted DNA-binding transcriptional regulator YafY
MLLILQLRGHSTARELAAALEVSERTILRDVEALSEAGLPIYTNQGAGGGIELVDGFETRLTGLTADEAECLFLVGQPRVAHRLGLGVPTRSAQLKLSNALPKVLAEQAEGLADWFLHDPDPWGGPRIPHGELRRIRQGIRRCHRIELYLGDAPALQVEPLGLVLKAGSWHLVTAEEAVVCLDDLRATRLTTQRFKPAPGFSLSDFWFRHQRRGLGDPRRRGAGVQPAGGSAG